MLETAVHIEKYIFNALERFTAKKMWTFKLVLLCFGTVLFFSFPSYELLLNRHEQDTWSVVLQQIDNPLDQHQFAPESHNAKRTFRLFVPLICRLLFIHNVYIIYALQLLVATAFFYLVARITEQITKDKVAAMLVTVSFSFIYAGQVGIVDVLAKFDGIAIACLLASIYFKNPLAIFFFSFAASWTDERGFIAAPMVFLWWKIQEEGLEKFDLKKLLIPKIKSSAVVISMAAYLAIRYLLTTRYGLKTISEGIGLQVLFAQLNMIFFGLWSTFEGLWVIVVLALLSLVVKRSYLILGLVIVASSLSISTSFLVLDITRSLIYCLPLFFISLTVLSEEKQPELLRKILMFCFFVCAMVPTYFAEGGFRIEGANPFIFKILDLLRG